MYQTRLIFVRIELQLGTVIYAEDPIQEHANIDKANLGGLMIIMAYTILCGEP